MRRRLRALLAAVLLAGSSAVNAQTFTTVSGNMKPTILTGDVVLPMPFAPGGPARGDIVIFRHPVRPEAFIKRLIGLPGDTVQLKGGVLFLNGQEVPQTPAGVFTEIFEQQGPMRSLPRCENGPVGEGGDCTASRFTETLPGGRTYGVLNIDVNGGGDNSDVSTVPEGHYFFMGDNRDNSNDSRFPAAAGGIGFVPQENLFGRLTWVMYSYAGSSPLEFWRIRWRRSFEPLR